MKKKITLILLCLLCLASGCKESGASLYSDGAGLYLDGKYEEAVEKLEEAKAAGFSDESDPSALNSVLGNAYMELQQIDKAIECYDEALSMDDDNVRNYVNLAVAYRQKGDTEKAKELYSKALSIDPDYAELNSSLGTLYLLEGNNDKAIECFRKAIEADPDLAVAYGNAALAYAYAGEYETAENYLKVAEEKGYRKTDAIKKIIEDLK